MTGLLQVFLFPDETLPSWVARLARANGKSGGHKFCTDIGLNYRRLKVGKKSDIEGLGVLTGRSTAELIDHALVFDAGHNIQFAGETFFKNFVRKHQLAFCPRCFAQDDARCEGQPDTRRYWRKAWLLNESRACTLHGCRLEALPRHPTGHDFCQVLDNNFATIAAHMAAPVATKPTFLDAFVSDRFAGLKAHGELLDQTSLGVAMHMARLLGVALVYGGNQSMRQLCDADIASATNQGLCAMRSGADGIHVALDKIVDPQARAVKLAYGRLSGSLHARQGDGFSVFKEILVEHASRHFFVHGKNMLDRNSAWTTVTEIANSTGIHSSGVLRRLHQAGIIKTPKGEERIPASALELFSDDAADLVKAKTACEIIGCDKNLLNALVEGGLVRPANYLVIQNQANANCHAYYRESELIAFRRTVEEKARCEASSDMVTLRRAARLTGVSKANIIARILSGECATVALSGHSVMADNVMIDPRDFGASGECVVFPEAARLLDVSVGTIGKLTELGVIAHKVNEARVFRFDWKMIHKHDIAAFGERYVSVQRLEIETGLDKKTIQRKMQSKGIRSAFSRSEIRAVFILRTQIAELVEGERLP